MKGYLRNKSGGGEAYSVRLRGEDVEDMEVEVGAFESQAQDARRDKCARHRTQTKNK